MYPAMKKDTYTKEGATLRKMAICFMILDASFMMVGLAVVGFQVMMMNLWICLWAYSMYLTLREWVIITYIVLKVMNVVELVLPDASPDATGLGGGYMDSAQLMGVYANAIYQGVCVFVLAKAYRSFRKAGGIKGRDVKGPLIEDVVAAKGLVIGTKVANVAESAAGKVKDKAAEKSY